MADALSEFEPPAPAKALANPLSSPVSGWPFPNLAVRGTSASAEELAGTRGPGAPSGITPSDITAQSNKVRQRYYDEANRLHSETRDTIKDIKGLGGKIDESMQRVRAAQDKADEANEAALKAMQKAPAQPEIDGVKNFMGVASIIGLLGGLFTRRPFQASANASAAAIEAYNSGDLKNYKLAYDSWKTNTELMFKIASMNQERVREIMYDEAMGNNERKTLLDLTLRATGQERLADAARTQGEDVVLQTMEKLRAADMAGQKQMQQLELMHERLLMGLEISQIKDRSSIDKYMTEHPQLKNYYQWEQGNPNATNEEKNAAWQAAQGKGGGANEQATPQEIDYWTNVLKAGGHLPPGLARTKAGSDFVRQLMRNMGKEGEDPGKFIEGVATVQADSGSLRNMTRMADAAVSFENTANKNFDTALRLAKDAVPTDLGPFFNRWVEEGEKMLGDTNVPPYITALLTASTEYAKIMSGSTGAQGSTVDARREAQEVFSPYLSKGQIDRVVGVAKVDMGNRKDSLYGQIDDIKGRLRSAGSGEPTSIQGQGVKGGVRVPLEHANDPDGKEYTGSDGKTYVKRGDLMVPK